MTKLKKFGKGLVAGFKHSKSFVEDKGPKVHRYLAKTAASTQKAFEVRPSRNRVDLTAGTRNKVTLTKRPKLKRVRGNLYWDYS